MNFVVIALPRTGSTHLTALLDRQSNITCHGEIFHPKKIFLRWRKTYLSRDALKELSKLRQNDPLKFLNRILGETHGSVHIGFKIFSGHNDEVLRHVVETESFQKVVLLRSNFLASYSSMLMRSQTRAGGTRTNNAPEIRFQPEKFCDYCDRVGRFYRDLFGLMNRTRQRFYLMNYEQVNDPWCFSTLVAFLGGDPARVTMASGREKANSPDIVSRFVNTSEVSEFLLAHELAHWRWESIVSLDPLRSTFPPNGQGLDGQLRNA